ncbi:hypothetical protein D3C76_1298810 [compost metagenome]
MASVKSHPHRKQRGFLQRVILLGFIGEKGEQVIFPQRVGLPVLRKPSLPLQDKDEIVVGGDFGPHMVIGLGLGNSRAQKPAGTGLLQLRRREIVALKKLLVMLLKQLLPHHCRRHGAHLLSLQRTGHGPGDEIPLEKNIDQNHRQRGHRHPCHQHGIVGHIFPAEAEHGQRQGQLGFAV